MSVLILSPNGQLTRKASLAAAVASPDTVGKTIVVTTAITTDDVTIPSTVALCIEKGGVITVNSGQTLTINGPFSAPLCQVFSVTAKTAYSATEVKFDPAAINVVEAIWFGAAGLQNAVNSISESAYRGYGVVQLMNDTSFVLLDTLIVPDYVTIRGTGISSLTNGNSRITASASFSSALTAGGDYTHPLIQLGNPDHAASSYWAHQARLENLWLYCGGMCNAGIYSDSANENSGVFNVWVYAALKYGIHLYNPPAIPSTNNRMFHCDVRDCTVSFSTTGAIHPNSGDTDLTNAAGVLVQSTSTYRPANITISKCTITHSDLRTGPYPNAGYYAQGCAGVTIRDCHAEFTTKGVVIDGTDGTIVDNFDGHDSLTHTTYFVNTPTYYALRNIYKQGGTYILYDATTDNTKVLGDDHILEYSSGRQLNDSLQMFNSVKTAGTSPGTLKPAGNILFRGFETSDGSCRVSGAIYCYSNGDWTANADTDYAPSAMYIGIGQASTTATPGNAPNIELTEGISTIWNVLKIRSGGKMNFGSISTYADNAAATTGGLSVGDVYRTSTGVLMVRY